MLLTTASAWATNITTHITYAGLTASDVTFTISGNGKSFELKNGETKSVGDIPFPNAQFTITCSSALALSSVSYSGEWEMPEWGTPSFNKNSNNGCTFEWGTMGGALTLNISVSYSFTGYTVHFDPNETEGGTGTMSDQAIATDVATNLSPCTFTNSFGLIFGGWSTEANGSVVYADGASVTNLAAAGQTITLYAKWVYGYTVHFDANGGTGTMADQGIPMNAYTNLRANTFTRPGYVFAGWSTTADGTGNSYADGQKIHNTDTSSGTITLYAQWMDASQYAVHFDPNANAGGTGTMADQGIERDVATNLSPCTFTNSFGLIFGGWSTEANGSVVYADGASVTNLAAAGQTITLYAKWVYGYTVHFDANGGTGTMADQGIPFNSYTNLRANTFTRSGYYFVGWSTSPNGSVEYTDGEEILNTTVSSGTITLYAQWTDYYTVHFDKNDDIFANGTMADQTFHFGETKQLSKCTFTGLGGYTFLGWSTTANGSVEYTDEQSVCDLTTTNGNVTLYAQWQAPVIALSYIVHFNANGGTGTMANQQYSNMQYANLNANTFTRDGYTFSGWNTQADGSGTTYIDEQNIHPSSDMTLYAQWSLNTNTHYAVHFNANGGTGMMYDQAIAAGTSADLTANTFIRDGYNFTGWNTQANGSGTNYADGATVSGLALAGQTVNLYAQWTENDATVELGNASDNAAIIADLNGQTRNVTLTGRTLTANSWNTLCVPFNLSSAQITSIFGAGTLVKTLSSYANVGNTVTITFETANEIVAGTPYIIMPANTVANPEFSGVTIDKTMNNVTAGDATFKGTYDPQALAANDKKKLFLANNMLWYPTGNVTVKACRAYFELTADVPELSNSAPNIVVDFGEETTGVGASLVNSEERIVNSEAWYTLDGRRLSGKPTQKGVYIHVDKKYVIR